MDITRRELLISAAAAAATRVAGGGGAGASPAVRSADDLAADEAYWRAVRGEFPVDPDSLHLNHAAVGSAPRAVLDAVQKYDSLLASQPTHFYYDVIEPMVEDVRTRLAAFLGCDREELAITRNASEGLQGVIFGLDLEPGDEVVTTTHDYSTVLDSLAQRARRDGILVTRVPFQPPADPGALLDALERALSPRTKLLVVCHITSATGQVLPAREICGMARARGIFTLVDGAQAVGQTPFALRDVGCDAYAASLHKYFNAALGTGILVLQRHQIGRIWPLMGAQEEQRDDIRKFESLGPGTIRLSPRTALPEAIAFNDRVGIANKAARLRFLARRWMDPVSRMAGVRMLSPLDPAAGCGIGSFVPARGTAQQLVQALWRDHRIQVRARGVEGEFSAVRVSPNIFTAAGEIDRFVAAVTSILKG
jgi:selenocysteine lyase/cysteine desulfurase